MTETQRKDKYIRLQKYLEFVRTSISSSTGELKEFWKREERKANDKIGKL